VSEVSESSARLPMVAETSDDPALKELFASAAAQQGRLSNLYRTLANSPAMLGAWTGMAWPLRHEPALERRLRELAIMRVAQRSRAVYEWAHHWHLAEQFGVPEEHLSALRDWRASTVFDERERAVLAYADAMVDLDVPDAVFEPLRRWFDDAQLVELTLTISFYCHVSRALVALRVELEPGFDPHLEAL
jgi:alkylhydroperoxidase family enzyme